MSNPASQSFDNLRGVAAGDPARGNPGAPPGAVHSPAARSDRSPALPVPSWPRRAWRASLAACLPQRCALCAAPSESRLVCGDCDRALPRLPPACPRCALPAPEGALCRSCARRPPPFARAVAVFAYAYPLDRLLQELKYAGQLALAPWFAEALARQVAVWPDVLVALPLAPDRQRARGYNQAGEIARALARHGGVAQRDALVRTRDTTPQAELHGAERARNMHGAFAARTSLAGLRIAIVDDVMTTGATLRAAAVAARAAGAREVDVWAVARTLPPAP